VAKHLQSILRFEEEGIVWGGEELRHLVIEEEFMQEATREEMEACDQAWRRRRTSTLLLRQEPPRQAHCNIPRFYQILEWNFCFCFVCVDWKFTGI
jgi:hypothetical protein